MPGNTCWAGLRSCWGERGEEEGKNRPLSQKRTNTHTLPHSLQITRPVPSSQASNTAWMGERRQPASPREKLGFLHILFRLPSLHSWLIQVGSPGICPGFLAGEGWESVSEQLFNPRSFLVFDGHTKKGKGQRGGAEGWWTLPPWSSS